METFFVSATVPRHPVDRVVRDGTYQEGVNVVARVVARSHHCGNCRSATAQDRGFGVFDQFKPKFTKRYANISQIAVDALKTYADEVRGGRFPDADHSYGMKPEEAAKLQRLIAAGK